MNHLVIAGAGIKFISQMTIEVMEHICKAKKLLFLVNDPALEEWILKKNPHAESLEKIYFNCVDRSDAYIKLKDKILFELESNELLCVVFYGHPLIYCEPGLQAALEAERLGYTVSILPGISTFDCIFSDLKINLSDTGLMSYEATQFINYKIMPSIFDHIVLWQVSVIENLKIVKEKVNNNPGLTKLKLHLLNFYNFDHLCTIYVASQYPFLPANIQTVILDQLDTILMPKLATIYIPPCKNRTESYITH